MSAALQWFEALPEVERVKVIEQAYSAALPELQAKARSERNEAIRAALQGGMSGKEAAQAFGVSEGLVSLIAGRAARSRQRPEVQEVVSEVVSVWVSEQGLPAAAKARATLYKEAVNAVYTRYGFIAEDKVKHQARRVLQRLERDQSGAA